MLENIHEIERFSKKKEGKKKNDTNIIPTTKTLLGSKKEELSLDDDDDFRTTTETEREREKEEERSAFGSFFATREVKKGARLNV